MNNSRRAWTVVALLAVFMMINTADRAVLGLAGPYIIRDLGLTNTQFGQVGSSFFLLYSLSAVAVGFLANHISSRAILVALVAVWSLAQAPLAFPVALETLILTRILLGAGEGPGYPVALNAVYKWFPNERRAVPSAIVAQGATLGVVLLVPLLNWIIVTYSWHDAFAALTLMGALWMLAWLAYGAEGQLDEQDRSQTAPQPRKSYLSLASNRNILGIWIGGFGAFWCYSLMIVWLPVYFANGLKVPQVWMGVAAALPWLTNTVVVIVMGLASQFMHNRGISTRYSRVYLALFCVMIGGALVSTAMLLGYMDPMHRLALLILGVAFPTVILAMSPPIIAEHVPPSQRAAMIGIGQALVTLAGVAAPFVTGRIVDASATSAAGFETGFLLCGALLLVSSTLGMAVLDPRRT